MGFGVAEDGKRSIVRTEAGPSTAAGRTRPRRTRAAAVLFDRDGTLIHDVPYNGDPRDRADAARRKPSIGCATPASGSG